jgi:hypothetical protein
VYCSDLKRWFHGSFSSPPPQFLPILVSDKDSRPLFPNSLISECVTDDTDVYVGMFCLARTWASCLACLFLIPYAQHLSFVDFAVACRAFGARHGP